MSEPSEVYHVHEHVYRCQDCGQMADAVPDLSSELERYREALERIAMADAPTADWDAGDEFGQYVDGEVVAATLATIARRALQEQSE